jgi:hypothetical protein
MSISLSYFSVSRGIPSEDFDISDSNGSPKGAGPASPVSEPEASAEKDRSSLTPTKLVDIYIYDVDRIA